MSEINDVNTSLDESAFPLEGAMQAIVMFAKSISALLEPILTHQLNIEYFCGM
jgi:hypothetical protein